MNAKTVGFLSLSFITLLSLLSSCQFTPENGQLPVNFNTGEVNTIIFSSKSKSAEERNYYDALLNLKKEYPKKLNSIQVIKKSNKALTDYYQVNTFPTIIVFDGNEEVVRLEGNRKITMIKKHLEKAYSN